MIIKGIKEFPDIKDSPKSVDISITGKCNLHCQYCFYADEMKTRPDLPTEQWLTFFNELGELGVRDLALSGGEVFVRPDSWELIDGLVTNRMQYSISSNGSCPGLAYEMTGDFNKANPQDCYRRFLEETGMKSILDTD